MTQSNNVNVDKTNAVWSHITNIHYVTKYSPELLFNHNKDQIIKKSDIK